MGRNHRKSAEEQELKELFHRDCLRDPRAESNADVFGRGYGSLEALCDEVRWNHDRGEYEHPVVCALLPQPDGRVEVIMQSIVDGIWEMWGADLECSGARYRVRCPGDGDAPRSGFELCRAWFSPALSYFDGGASVGWWLPHETGMAAKVREGAVRLYICTEVNGADFRQPAFVIYADHETGCLPAA